MVDWPMESVSFSDNKTFTQAQNAALKAKEAERDAKFATKAEIQELKKAIDELKEAVKSINVHKQSDLDGSSTAQHHTLGLSPNNASPGHHTHDGKNSNKINLTGTSLAGAVFTGAALAGANFNGTDISPYWLKRVLDVTENPPNNNIRLLNGITVTGSRNVDGWRTQIMAILVRLGVTNSTTA